MAFVLRHAGPFGRKGRQRLRLASQRIQLRCQAGVVGIQSNPGCRLQQDAVGIVQLTGVQHEYSAALVEPDVAVLEDQQAQDLVAQVLIVTLLALVQDHQVDLQPTFAPVSVRLQQLLNDFQPLFRRDAHQQDRIVA